MGEEREGEDGAGPGAEVFGGEVEAFVGDGVEVGVDVYGADGVGVAVVVEVGEEFVAGGVAAGGDDTRELSVLEVDGVADAGLAFEVEDDPGAADGDVAAAHGGEAVGVVGAGVLGIADADVGGLHEAEDGGEDFFAGQAGALEVMFDLFADGRKRGTELEHVFVLGLVARGAPAGVVAGLLAAAGVASGGLQMAVGVGADPDAGPRGRDDEGLDAGQGFFVAEGFAVGVFVAEVLAVAMAGDAGGSVVHVAEVGGAGGG